MRAMVIAVAIVVGTACGNGAEPAPDATGPDASAASDAQATMGRFELEWTVTVDDNPTNCTLAGIVWVHITAEGPAEYDVKVACDEYATATSDLPAGSYGITVAGFSGGQDVTPPQTVMADLPHTGDVVHLGVFALER